MTTAEASGNGLIQVEATGKIPGTHGPYYQTATHIKSIILAAVHGDHPAPNGEAASDPVVKVRFPDKESCSVIVETFVASQCDAIRSVLGNLGLVIADQQS